MHFLVAEPCLALGLRAAAVILHDVHIGPASPELRAEIAVVVEAIRSHLAAASEVRTLPEIVAFADILRKVGVNPRRKRPTPERLLTICLERGDLPAINALVDAYNLVSVRRLCSLGAHDLDRITLPVSLRMLTGEELFMPLGGEAESGVTAGEFGYVDDAGRVLCRLDLLQADFSKVTAGTTNVLLIVEATTAHPPGAIQEAVTDAVAVITRYCGGSAEVIALP